jgi:UDP-GlcNAc:undecaprenyl-phosphate GlcNAc-1-phosphate transferase
MSTDMTIWLLAAFVISLGLTPVVRMLATRFGVMDAPTAGRKVHDTPTPLMGGVAIFLAFTGVLLVALGFTDTLIAGEIALNHYIGVIAAAAILIIGGVLDDIYELPPHKAIVAPLVAVLTVIGFGIEVDKLTNPFGGVIDLAWWQSDIIVFIWLMVVMYTTKFLDGLDGLATGVSATGALMILLLSLTTAYYQPDVALLAAIVLGAFLGFLGWNIHPAKIFLGEGGSTLVGFLLGVLAVISGGKLATAMLALGVPMLDLVWTIVRRFSKGGLKRVFQSDRRHLHHRLLDLGWRQHTIVGVYLLVATVFGTAALFLQSKEKLVALMILTAIVVIVAVLLVLQERREKELV